MLRYQVSTIDRVEVQVPISHLWGNKATFEVAEGQGGDQIKVTSSTWAATCSLPTQTIVSKVPNTFSFFFNFVKFSNHGLIFQFYDVTPFERHFEENV
jgi:hypothetical protein